VGVVVWMSLWESFSSIPSWSWIKCSILLRNQDFIMPSWRHCLDFIIKIISSENISALFSKSLLKKGICSNNGSVTLILWNNIVFSFNRFKSVGHVVGRSSIHMTWCPLKEVIICNGGYFSMFSIVKLILRLTRVGVIKIRLVSC